jgi:hypothetical protein
MKTGADGRAGEIFTCGALSKFIGLGRVYDFQVRAGAHPGRNVRQTGQRLPLPVVH